MCTARTARMHGTYLLLGSKYTACDLSEGEHFNKTVVHWVEEMTLQYLILKIVHLVEHFFWLRYELKESVCLSVCLSVRHKLVQSSQSSSFQVRQHSGSDLRAIEHSESTQRALKALKSESYHRSLKYCVLFYNRK